MKLHILNLEINQKLQLSNKNVVLSENRNFLLSNNTG